MHIQTAPRRTFHSEQAFGGSGNASGAVGLGAEQLSGAGSAGTVGGGNMNCMGWEAKSIYY